MPEPVLVSIAAAVAAKAATSLYDLVKKTFAKRAGAPEVLTAAEGAEADSPEVAALAEELAAVERDDPAFGAQLRAQWATQVDQHAEHGGVTNQITGTVTGKVVQARDIEGGVSF